MIHRNLPGKGRGLGQSGPDPRPRSEVRVEEGSSALLGLCIVQRGDEAVPASFAVHRCEREDIKVNHLAWD